MMHKKGPQLNDHTPNTTNRDNLGITGAQTTLQAELCPVVNTVTYRAFYWIFLTWNYYDFYQYSGETDFSRNAGTRFNEDYVKKNDYYFVLGNLINNNPDTKNLVGIEKTTNDLSTNNSGPFKYNRDYFVSYLGGMQYYNAGCRTLGFTTDTDSEGNPISGLNRLTKGLGTEMGKAFEKVIKNTEYYRKYRFKDTKVPRHVLEEFGSVVSLDLNGFDECKSILRRELFEERFNELLDNKHLIESKDYLIFLYREYQIKNPGAKEIRKVLYDYFSPRGAYKYDFPESLKYVVKAWEVVVGRQYFTTAIEMICKAMIDSLDVPKTMEQWVGDLIDDLSWEKVDVDQTIESLLPSCNFNFDERENLIEQGYRSVRDTSRNCDTGIRIILSVYNRFKDRPDIENKHLSIGGEVSVSNLIELVDNWKDRPVIDLLQYIMREWIVYQNEVTALEKVMRSRSLDGYIFERVDEKYARTGKYPATDFQGIRLINLLQVMKDLDVITE